MAMYPICVGMACSINRIANLDKILPTFYGVNKFFLHLNGNYDSIEIKKKHPKLNLYISQTSENLGDKMKFYGMNFISEYTKGCYYLSIDDDILYPNDYLFNMTMQLQRYNNKPIIVVHSASFNPYLGSKGFYSNGRRSVTYFQNENKDNINVMIPGTGTACFHSKIFPFTDNDCEITNMADIWAMIKAVKLDIPIIATKRTPKWLKQLPEFGSAIHKDNSIRKWMEKAVDNNIDDLKKYYDKYKIKL